MDTPGTSETRSREESDLPRAVAVTVLIHMGIRVSVKAKATVAVSCLNGAVWDLLLSPALIAEILSLSSSLYD